MKCLDLEPESAEDALVTLGRHIPAGTDFGRPLVALKGREPGEVTFLMASGPDGAAVWLVSPVEAARVVGLPDAMVELVSYSDGAETDRAVKHERDLGLPDLP